ncbi:MAG TPA: carbohydrate ABC transporter permease [Candidatus Cybelea sp.]|nr:carbohydrate ABC transporter permease [Candidatus Cybelea sp.]
MARHRTVNRVAVYTALTFYTLIATFPIALVMVNSFKDKAAIFGSPLSLPGPSSFTLIGFQQVMEKADFVLYFTNSIIVTVVSLLLVVLTGAMAAWALGEYRFKGNTLLALYMAIGIMVPIRLGTVSILKMVVAMNLINTLTALILVYTAMGLPLAILILGEFMAQIPRDLREAARCDGVSEYTIFTAVILPLIRPAVATVAVFTMVPIWNDLWFPLILASGDGKQTITLGAQQFIGQYVTNWNAVLSALTLAIAPILVLYVLFSRHLVRGLTMGAVK